MNKEVIVRRLKANAEEIRQRFSVKALSLFGSAARGELANGSDADILVVFDHKATFDLFMDLKILPRRTPWNIG